MWLGVGLSVVALIAGYFVGKIDRTDKGKPKPSEKEALWNFVKGVDRVFWSFAITYFLIHAVVSTYTNNASNLLGVRAARFTEAVVRLSQSKGTIYMNMNPKKSLVISYDLRSGNARAFPVAIYNELRPI